MSTTIGSRALAAVVYISEGRRTAVLDVIEGIARKATRTRPVALVNVFRDTAYNRTGFTFAGADVDEIRVSALEVAEASLKEVDMRTHDASHPRVGVVDHVSCHSLTGGRRDAAELARGIGSGLGDFGVPVKLYGDAARDAVTLDEIRRQSGYFSGAKDGAWAGKLSAESKLVFDYGPDVIPEETGFAMVGAVPWVCNYNVPLIFSGIEGVDSETLSKEALAFGRVVARRVSGRGGGLPMVQSMALPHGAKVEVACNLLDIAISSTQDVQDAIAAVVNSLDVVKYLGAGATVTVEGGYVTNQSIESIVNAVRRL